MLFTTPERSWKSKAGTPSFIPILLVLAGILFTAGCRDERSDATMEEGYKVFLIGIDATDWYLLEPLLEEGALTNMNRLIQNGSRSLLMTIMPTSSPIIWNSIATGKTKEKHGIIDFARKVDGEYRPYTSNMVKARTVWDLLNEWDVSTNVVGWWTTWPAQEVKGRMVSSYVSLSQRGWKGSVVEDVPNQTYPEELLDELAPLIDNARSAMPDRVRRIFGEVEESRLSDATRSNFEDTKWCLLSDEIYRQSGIYVQKRYPAPFFAIYFGGIDVIGHRFWKYMEPWAFKEYRVSEEEKERFGRCIIDYYKMVDEWLGEILELADERTTIILVSDHGMQAYPPSSNPYIADRSGAHDNAESGVIILSGRHIKKNVKLKRPPSIFDIAPTVMYLMGLPVDEEMDGKVIIGAIEEDFVARHPLKKQRYEGKPRSDEGFISSKADAELIRRLKALGYLK